MQKWVVWVVVAVLGLALLGGGGLYALYAHSQNKPSPMWVPIPLKNDLPKGEQENLATELLGKLLADDIRRGMVKDLDLAEAFGVAGDNEAAAELERRLFVEIGEMQSPQGMVPSMNIGARGTRAEKELSSRIAERAVREVLDILGIRAVEKSE